MARWIRMIRDQRGVTSVEYGLILGFIFLAIIVGLKGFAAAAIAMWDYIASQVLSA